MRTLIIILFSLKSICCLGQENDEKQIGTTIDNLLKYLSFRDTTSTQLDSINSIFTTDAKLVANFNQTPRSFTVPEFVENIRNSIKSGQTSSEEKDLARKIDVFGNVAHVFSTYEFTMVGKQGKVARRGINSIQLLKQDGRWLIYSLIWDRERDGLRIPPKYLDAK